jgi:phytoene dehydrogenase-like protein
MYDAVVVGSGPNGLAAAITIARRGHRVLVVEAADGVGGGTSTTELTLPGYRHDVCSAVHTTGAVSPFFATLPLEQHGLEWCEPPLSLAHPLDDGSCVTLSRSLEETARGLGEDGERYVAMLRPFLSKPQRLLAQLLGPLRIPRDPILLARFGLLGLRSASGVARARFEGDRAAALFAGCAAHSILPLERMTTAAVALVFLLIGHVRSWPVARGGSQQIAFALADHLRSLGGEVRTGFHVRSLDELPEARAVLFDTDPRQLATIAGEALPAGYRRRLLRYRYGPGVFKLDWALSAQIPWRATQCHQASTVHVGGDLAQIADAEARVWRGEHAERPFVIVCQQSHFDSSRAPAGKHTGYAYCHVPAESRVDMTEAIEVQIERFAPGFRDAILARHTLGPLEFERRNPSHVGGAISGGVADLGQLFTRPVFRLDPYTTPNPRLFLCSHSTPPGAGVHGMCGYHAGLSVLRRWHGRRAIAEPKRATLHG